MITDQLHVLTHTRTLNIADTLRPYWEIIEWVMKFITQMSQK